ncbi:group II intron maturase-specific domain-containing protein [Streptomyces microflavus]
MRMHMTFHELARWINPIVRGWMQYYGAYYRTLHPSSSASTPTCCAGSARSTDGSGRSKVPTRAGYVSPANTRGSLPSGHGPRRSGDQDDKSRVTGDRYARFCGSPGVRFPRATRPLICAWTASPSPPT